MKLQADEAEGVNVISHVEPGRIRVNGVPAVGSVLVPWSGEVAQWRPASFDDLREEDFAAMLAMKPELVIFGSGNRIRFVRPALLRALIDRRIGVETMDTGAACRTYNVLAGEGRQVLAALLVSEAPADAMQGVIGS